MTAPLLPLVREAFALMAEREDPPGLKTAAMFRKGDLDDSPEIVCGMVGARAGVDEPIPMLLYCPKCGLQHVDAPEMFEATVGIDSNGRPDWHNPPHRSHLCHGCGCIWRPADVPTNGVASIMSVGKADTWEPGSVDSWSGSAVRARSSPPAADAMREATSLLRELVGFISDTGLLIADDRADQAYRRAHAFLDRTALGADEAPAPEERLREALKVITRHARAALTSTEDER